METAHAHGNSTSPPKQQRPQSLARLALHDLLCRNAGLDAEKDLRSRVPKSIQAAAARRAIN
jgi:hypothetical protein